MNKEVKILIVDDEPQIRKFLVKVLSEKYSCESVESAEAALNVLARDKFDLVITDIEMSGMSGIEMIPAFVRSAPDTVAIVISGNQNVQSVIEAMRVGAFDYIQKPFDLNLIEVIVERALEHHHLLADKARYEHHLEELVTERTDQLNYLKYHDAMTDLPNRVLFEDRLRQIIIQAAEFRRTAAVALIALDRFGNIEDTLGHPLAEQIIGKIADRLKTVLRQSETVARLGRKQFALLLTQIPDNEFLIKLIDEINQTINSIVEIEEHEIFVTASIGISLFPDDGADSQTLLKNAGAALSRARQLGGSNFQFYTPDMNDQALRRLTMESRLRRALERDEFEVFYQPKIEIESGKIFGMEALLRWRHPELGLVSPGEFIPLVEENGLILPIGRWILRTACEQNKRWLDQGFDLYLSVNISTQQFQETDLAATVLQIIGETQCEAHRLELEVTESAFVRNAASTVEVLNRLKDTGVKISVDDFGTGYSSLGYLKNLPIDILKIDRTFVRDITTDDKDAALVTAIITLSRSLNLKVVAEGVETKEQLAALKKFGCDCWQGFLASKPVTAEEFENLLTADKRYVE